jgi:hypothetical protein
MSLNDLKHLENRIQESGKIILKLNQQLRQEKETKRSLHVLLQDTRNNYRLTKGWLPTDLQKIRDGHIVYGTKKDIDNIWEGKAEQRPIMAYLENGHLTET